MKLQRVAQCIAVISVAVLSRQAIGNYNGDKTTTAGDVFFFAIPRVAIQSPVIVISIDTPSESANYTVETSSELIATGQVNGNAHVITLNNNLQVGSSGYFDRNKGIRVLATGSSPLIVLVVVSFSTTFPIGLDSFKVYQNFETKNVSGTYEYYALSTDYNGQLLNRRSELLLIGNHNDTIVSITPTQTVSLPEDAQNSAAALVSVAPGSTHNVTLNEFQTLLVFNSNFDITGTRIVSNKPLTVLTGHQCAQFPTTATFCEPVHVQMPPTFLWGKEFLLAPFAGRTSQQQYKVVTAENSTTIVYKCGTSTAIGRVLGSPGSGDYLSFPAGSYCSLVATKPIFVVQLGAGFSTDNLGDPVMAIVSPTTQYIKCTTFRVNTALFPSSFITITILPEHFGINKHVLLDGNKFNCSWNEIYNSSASLAGYGCNVSTTTGKHFVNHSDDNGFLSVIAYGWSTSPAWGHAFLTGMSLEIFDKTSTSISDPQTVKESLPYFNLDGFANVMELPRELDASSPPIYFSDHGFPYLVYGNQEVTSIYVNENGLFSFGKPYSFSHPNVFPTTNIYSRIKDVVAPFWSDNDIRKNGTIRYLVIKRGSSNPDESLLNEVAAHLVKTAVHVDSFEPKWMIIAQWDKVHPYPHGTDSHEGIPDEFLSKTNTYQGIIVTDRINTYYIFTYICGELQWSGGHGLDHAVVGYNSHGDYFYNTPGSGYENIADLVSCSFEVNSQRKKRSSSTSNVTGKVPKNDDMCNELKKCVDLIEHDNLSIKIGDIPTILNNLPECPPSYYYLYIDLLFEPDATKPGCLRSKVKFDPAGAGISVLRNYLFAQQCCYYTSGGLITDNADGPGSLLEILDPTFESQMYDSCCIIAEKNCGQYRKRRPINNGTNYLQPYQGWVFGDPHYDTFDGAHHTGFFTMNYHTVLGVGHSEDIDPPIFTIQADFDGFFITSVAFGIRGDESYQFVYNEVLDVFIIATNQENLENPQPVPFDNGVYNEDIFEIRKEAFSSDFVNYVRLEAIHHKRHIVFWMSYRLLDNDSLRPRTVIHVQLPQSLCKDERISVYGHLGNCNQLPEDDLYPDSDDQIDPDSQQLLFFRNSGSRKRRQAPQLSNCSSAADVCANSSHNIVPKFEDLTFTDAQRQFCNNLSTCLFDLSVTGSEEFAENTRNIEENSTKTAEILSNQLPSFSGNQIFNITVGIENIYTFDVEDSDDNFTVTVNPNEGQLVDNGNGMYTFHWMASTIPIKAVVFRAEDAHGAVVLLSPQLHVCSCFNGGLCTLDGVSILSSLVINMTCLCTEAYGGDSCTEDRNGCSEIECFEGVECFDVPAPGVGAVCGSCPQGYTGDGLKCFDINECLESPGLCDQVCKNTVGSYVCGCHTGFMVINGSSQCQDVNECSGVNNCQQQCNNTIGSYMCSCLPGFSLNADSMTCTPQQPCVGGNSCSHICAVIGGMEKCFCPIGLELTNGSTTNCVDINECDLFSPCEQVCNNSMGSYMCFCESGYILMSDMQTCADVDECKAAALNGTQLCFNNTQCVNTPGSYDCTCVPGYILVNGKCERNIEKAAEVQIIVPLIGQNNSHTFVVQTYDKSELTSYKIQAFRVATANAINRFCAKRECTIVTSSGETQSMALLHVKPQDVAILTTMITVSSTGRPRLIFYVQEDNDTFVSASTLSSALQNANDIYRDAGFLSKDLCAQHTPCLNGGTCTSVGTDSGYTCACVTGYTGMNCTVHIGGCASNVCLNGGTCTSVGSDNGYTCICATGYTGRNCSVNIDDCASNPCQNGGTCTDEVGRFVCSCPPNMMGDRCEQRNNLLLVIILGAVVGVLLLLLVFVLLMATVCCIWSQVVNNKKSPGEIHAPLEIPRAKVEIPMHARA